MSLCEQTEKQAINVVGRNESLCPLSGCFRSAVFYCTFTYSQHLYQKYCYISFLHLLKPSRYVKKMIKLNQKCMKWLKASLADVNHAVSVWVDQLTGSSVAIGLCLLVDYCIYWGPGTEGFLFSVVPASDCGYSNLQAWKYRSWLSRNSQRAWRKPFPGSAVPRSAWRPPTTPTGRAMPWRPGSETRRWEFSFYDHKYVTTFLM